MLEQYRRYQWADEAHELAWTVASIAGRPSDEVIELYGADSASVEELTFNDAEKERNEHFDECSLLQVLTHDSRIVVIEPNGWLGAEAGRARALSADRGRFFSIYWSPAATRIVQAVDGRSVADFEPLFADRAGRGADTFPDWIDNYLWYPDGLPSTMLLAMEQQAGVAFDRHWLEMRLPTYRVYRDPLGQGGRQEV